MVIRRGDLWWATLAAPRKSEPGFDRPVLVLQTDEFNRSRIGTVVVLAITSNTTLADAPGNVLVVKDDSGLSVDSVVNVSQMLTINRSFLSLRIGALPRRHLAAVETGARLVLGL